jgi:hypothetical protein
MNSSSSQATKPKANFVRRVEIVVEHTVTHFLQRSQGQLSQKVWKSARDVSDLLSAESRQTFQQAEISTSASNSHPTKSSKGLISKFEMCQTQQQHTICTARGELSQWA